MEFVLPMYWCSVSSYSMVYTFGLDALLNALIFLGSYLCVGCSGLKFEVGSNKQDEETDEYDFKFLVFNYLGFFSGFNEGDDEHDGGRR